MPQSGQECCTGTQPCTQLAPLPQSLPTPHGTAQAMLSHPEWQSLAWPDPCLAALPWGGRPRRYPDRSCVAGPPLPGPPASWPAALAAARRSRRAWARACMVSLKRRRSSSAISRVRAVLSLAPAQEVEGMGGAECAVAPHRLDHHNCLAAGSARLPMCEGGSSERQAAAKHRAAAHAAAPAACSPFTLRLLSCRQVGPASAARQTTSTRHTLHQSLLQPGPLPPEL